ncbi:hypothetical protein PaecuDRAFT_2511 [Paenibacillus curdlanolyticus YK9]|uniref:Uncharacterized protein n=1 Tax=Paenibacillus curdlanolyticus YK9 TaxID=717606 RepID=E0IA22_9BACL|nr:hypothetical protein [Paenibacillus curdlanolyticus]EFM10599.1 hypothetical protein PaecuDRAFT_2511 [Paenibacillus curdlanolyticus YK9]
MSQTTLFSLIKPNKNTDLATLHQKKNYFYSAAPWRGWNILALEGYEKEQKTWSKQLSSEHQLDVIFLAANDFYQEAVYYHYGHQVAWVKFDADDHAHTNYSNLKLFLDGFEDQEQYDELRTVVTEIERNQEDLEPYDRFFEAFFQLSQLEGIDYETLFMVEDTSIYSEYQFVIVEKRKTIRPKQVVLAVLGELLLEKGYKYIPDSPNHAESMVFRNEAGYRFTSIVGFEMGGIFGIGIIFGTAEGGFESLDQLKYANEAELRRGLIKAWNQVILAKIMEFQATIEE